MHSATNSPTTARVREDLEQSNVSLICRSQWIFRTTSKTKREVLESLIKIVSVFGVFRCFVVVRRVKWNCAIHISPQRRNVERHSGAGHQSVAAPFTLLCGPDVAALYSSSYRVGAPNLNGQRGVLHARSVE